MVAVVKLAPTSNSTNPVFGCPEYTVKPSATLAAGFMTRRISRNPAAASGQTCRQYLVKTVASEWQAVHGAAPQVDTTILDCRRVPSASLRHHSPGWIDARDMPHRRQFSQTLDNHTWPETDFQHAVVRPDLKKLRDPCAAPLVCARHDDAAQLTQDPSRSVKHAEENFSRRAHGLPVTPSFHG